MRGTVWDDERLSDPHRQPDKAARVRVMFDAIAPTYERVNRILSLGMDARWRRRAVGLARVSPADRALDVACGTGDFTRAVARPSPRLVVGCDFAERMLSLAASRDDRAIRWCRGNAMALPFADQCFSLVSCAFGVRNFGDLAIGLREFNRVLWPGGRAVILEFSMPRSGVLGRLYHAYFNRVLPGLATLLSGDSSGAYHYLPKSVSSFVDALGMIQALRVAGFERVECHRQTAGIVTVFIAWKG